MDTEPAKNITLSIDSNLDNLCLMGGAIRGVCHYLPFNERATQNLELAVTEAVVNVVKHAYGSKKGNRVIVHVSYYADRITVEIIDAGSPMDPVLLHRPEGDMIDPLKETGRGLFIIRSLMDEVSYESAGRMNKLKLTLFVKPPDSIMPEPGP